MRYLVVERFRGGARAVYERAAVQGRLLPDGLGYVDSWVVDESPLRTCYQLMETDDPSLLEVWMDRWRDLVDFEVHPVLPSAVAAERAMLRG